MDTIAHLDAPCRPDQLWPHLDDLSVYPAWVSLVHRASPAAPAPDDTGPAWDVELRATLGPLARSKRLRMMRTVCDAAAGEIRFERAEVDGRQHAPWRLIARVHPTADGSRLEMHLHYGGRLWTGGVLERVLADSIESGRARLLARVADPTRG